MKRIAVLLTACMLALFLAACGNSSAVAQEEALTRGSQGESSQKESSQAKAAEGKTADPYQCLTAAGTPDIAALQQINPEVFGWLEIVDSDISYPLLQSATEEAYYLNHDIYGNENEDGCIYTEDCNSTEMEDKNTVIYGRNTETMFARLHQFQDRDFFDSHKTVRIYLKDRALEYRIFAAYPYDDRHLIASYDFSDEKIFSLYLKDVFAIREMDAFIDKTMVVTEQDTIITLSTGITGQANRRYLVQAVRCE